MSKSKRPAASKAAASSTSAAHPAVPAEDQLEEALIGKLADFAVTLARADAASDAVHPVRLEMRRLIAKSLRQQQDDVLYGALECTRDDDMQAAYPLLRTAIETAAEIVFFSRGGRSYEVNAFVIPMFVRTVGGLDSDANFRDADAFAALTRSIQEAGLESPDAKVALVSYAYHLDEIDAITYSHLEATIRDAFAALTDKKITATPAIDRSMRGWPESRFGADDTAVELRFLLGFALKTVDDPFYRIPEETVAMETYFAARAQRFQAWSEPAAALLKRCLTSGAGDFDVHFLYQDLFHGGKERGIAEYMMLQMMSALDHGLQQGGVDAAQTRAVMGPVHAEEGLMLRVNLYRDGDDQTVVATAEKPLEPASDLPAELDDTCDALMTLGVGSVALAEAFDVDGHAVRVQPYAG